MDSSRKSDLNYPPPHYPPYPYPPGPPHAGPPFGHSWPSAFPWQGYQYPPLSGYDWRGNPPPYSGDMYYPPRPYSMGPRPSPGNPQGFPSMSPSGYYPPGAAEGNLHSEYPPHPPFPLHSPPHKGNHPPYAHASASHSPTYPRPSSGPPLSQGFPSPRGESPPSGGNKRSADQSRRNFRHGYNPRSGPGSAPLRANATRDVLNNRVGNRSLPSPPSSPHSPPTRPRNSNPTFSSGMRNRGNMENIDYEKRTRDQYRYQHSISNSDLNSTNSMNSMECKPCGKTFTSNKQILAHVKTHEKCTHPGCDFSAIKSVLREHLKTEHGVKTQILSERASRALAFRKKESEEEVKKWIEERRKNYPTAANILKKRMEAKERKNRFSDDDIERRKKIQQILKMQKDLGLPVPEIPPNYFFPLLHHRRREKGNFKGESASKTEADNKGDEGKQGDDDMNSNVNSNSQKDIGNNDEIRKRKRELEEEEEMKEQKKFDPDVGDDKEENREHEDKEKNIKGAQNEGTWEREEGELCDDVAGDYNNDDNDEPFENTQGKKLKIDYDEYVDSGKFDDISDYYLDDIYSGVEGEEERKDTGDMHTKNCAFENAMNEFFENEVLDVLNRDKFCDGYDDNLIVIGEDFRGKKNSHGSNDVNYTPFRNELDKLKTVNDEDEKTLASLYDVANDDQMNVTLGRQDGLKNTETGDKDPIMENFLTLKEEFDVNDATDHDRINAADDEVDDIIMFVDDEFDNEDNDTYADVNVDDKNDCDYINQTRNSYLELGNKSGPPNGLHMVDEETKVETNSDTMDDIKQNINITCNVHDSGNNALDAADGSVDYFILNSDTCIHGGRTTDNNVCGDHEEKKNSVDMNQSLNCGQDDLIDNSVGKDETIGDKKDGGDENGPNEKHDDKTPIEDDLGNRKRRKVCYYFFHKRHCKKGKRCTFSHSREDFDRMKDRPYEGKERGGNSGPHQAKGKKEKTKSLLEKLLDSEIKKEKSHILQIARFLVDNNYLQSYPNKPLQFFPWTLKEN